MQSCVPQVKILSDFGDRKPLRPALDSLPKEEKHFLLTSLLESICIRGHDFPIGHPKNPTVCILTFWGSEAYSRLNLLSLMGTAVHFLSISSVLVEVNQSFCQAFAKQPTATLQIRKHPFPLNPATGAQRRDSWIYVPRRQWYSHLLVKQVEKRFGIKRADIHLRLYLDSDITKSPLKQGKLSVLLYFKCQRLFPYIWSEACYFKHFWSLGVRFSLLAITSKFLWETAEISPSIWIFDLATLPETHLNQSILGP